MTTDEALDRLRDLKQDDKSTKAGVLAEAGGVLLELIDDADLDEAYEDLLKAVLRR